MPAGDLYTLTDAQLYVALDNNPALNVYAYRQVSGSGDAAALSLAFQSVVLPDIINIQNVNVGHFSWLCVNLDDPTDFNLQLTSGVGWTGLQSGDCLPRYNAFSFFYQRTTRAVRNGWKRIMGVSEAWNNNGAVTDSGALAALNTLAISLGSVLTDGSGNAWNPRIYRREDLSHTPPIVRGDFPVGAVFYKTLTTQNTRKR